MPLTSVDIVRRRCLREMGGAPRNSAPRNRFRVRIVKPSGCHCTDGHLTSKVFTEDFKNIVECRPPSGALPLSLSSATPGRRLGPRSCPRGPSESPPSPPPFGRRCLSNATCLARPHVFYALFVVSRITIFAKSFATFEESLRQTSSVRQVVSP